jgi:hypothetical protein
MPETGYFECAGMSSLPTLCKASDQIELIQQQLELCGKTGADDRHRLVALRRELADQLSQVSTHIESVVPLLTDNQARDLRQKFSTMRTAIATHQSNWPAIALDGSAPAYRTSVQNLRNSTKYFINFVHSLV